MKPYIIPFEQLKNTDVELVGGKNASIGEMISALATVGVSVPGGFATTSHAYRDFLAHDGLDERIRSVLAALDVDDVERLAVVGAQIRGWLLSRSFSSHGAKWAKPPAAPMNSPSRSDPRRPPKICRRRPSPGSRRLF
jgi:phosphoenolpyruvate synthase/pyruvate phosphate dikinase